MRERQENVHLIPFRDSESLGKLPRKWVRILIVNFKNQLLALTRGYFMCRINMRHINTIWGQAPWATAFINFILLYHTMFWLTMNFLRYSFTCKYISGVPQREKKKLFQLIMLFNKILIFWREICWFLFKQLLFCNLSSEILKRAWILWRKWFLEITKDNKTIIKYAFCAQSSERCTFAHLAHLAIKGHMTIKWPILRQLLQIVFFFVNKNKRLKWKNYSELFTTSNVFLTILFTLNSVYSKWTKI